MTALDTMTIIWGLKVSGARRGNPKQPGLSDLRFRARFLLEMLEEEGQAILFSTVSLAEVLVRVDEKMHEQFIATVQQKFYCPPFNLPAVPWQQNFGSVIGSSLPRTRSHAPR